MSSLSFINKKEFKKNLANKELKSYSMLYNYPVYVNAAVTHKFQNTKIMTNGILLNCIKTSKPKTIWDYRKIIEKGAFTFANILKTNNIIKINALNVYSAASMPFEIGKIYLGFLTMKKECEHIHNLSSQLEKLKKKYSINSGTYFDVEHSENRIKNFLSNHVNAINKQYIDYIDDLQISLSLKLKSFFKKQRLKNFFKITVEASKAIAGIFIISGIGFLSGIIIKIICLSGEFILERSENIQNFFSKSYDSHDYSLCAYALINISEFLYLNKNPAEEISVRNVRDNCLTIIGIDPSTFNKIFDTYYNDKNKNIRELKIFLVSQMKKNC